MLLKTYENLLSEREYLKKIPKFLFFLFLKNPLFSTHYAVKNYLTQKVETLQAFKEYIYLQPEKMVKKIQINNEDIKVLLIRGYNTDIENYRKISNYENINFVLETRAIAQMKGILILIKSYKRHICHIRIFDPLLGPQREKLTRISRNWPYLKSRLCKKYKCQNIYKCELQNDMLT